MTELVLYRDIANSQLPSGTYLGMFHGRVDPQEELSDWGSDGPVIGPITGYHTTYGSHIRVGFATPDLSLKFFPEGNGEDWIDLKIVDGMLFYQDVYYGDWTIFNRVSTDLSRC